MLEFEDSASVQRRILLGALAGFVAGNALQMQQAALCDVPLYVGLLALAAAGYWIAARAPSVLRHALAIGAMVVFGFCTTGLRSHGYLHTQLDPVLDGRDVQVSGVVTDLPQGNESGLRFRLQIESASLDGAAVAIPPRIDVGWSGVFTP